MRWQRDDYTIDTDPDRIDLDGVCEFLATSYWAAGVPRAKVERAIANSLCFGLYTNEGQVGFARVVSDLARFAWLADVFVLPPHRGRALGKWLVECVVSHPETKDVGRWLLGTRDAHGLYEAFGWRRVEGSQRYMARDGGA